MLETTPNFRVPHPLAIVDVRAWSALEGPMPPEHTLTLDTDCLTPAWARRTLEHQDNLAFQKAFQRALIFDDPQARAQTLNVAINRVMRKMGLLERCRAHTRLTVLPLVAEEYGTFWRVYAHLWLAPSRVLVVSHVECMFYTGAENIKFKISRHANNLMWHIPKHDSEIEEDDVRGRLRNTVFNSVAGGVSSYLRARAHQHLEHMHSQRSASL